MQTVEYSLDDIGQVSLEPVQNMGIHLVQCDTAFGFEKTPQANVTAKYVDELLRNKTTLANKKINFIEFNWFLSRLNLHKLKVVVDGKVKNKKAVGYPGFALVVDFKGFYLSDLYLIVKSHNATEVDSMVDAIVKISKKYNLLLVDDSLGVVVDSKDKLCIQQYLSFEDL